MIGRVEVVMGSGSGDGKVGVVMGRVKMMMGRVGVVMGRCEL